MSLSLFLITYLLGGLTFLPLILAALLIPAWLLLPQTGREVSDLLDGEKKDDTAKGGDAEEVDTFSPDDDAATGSFAVLRSFNLPSALAALSAKDKAAQSADGVAAGDGVAQESASVYQTMYRSMFDRSRTALNKSSLVQGEEPIQARQAAQSTAGSKVYYIVIRHGHLMLYNSPAQLEVKHVISLAHHTVSLSDGDGDDADIVDPELFIKRTAIVLRPKLSATNGTLGHGTSAQPNPFYLFSANCTEKEDFYHAIVLAQSPAPVPQPLDPACAIKLQSALHSTSLTPETRALNALASRIFLALHRTPFMKNHIRSKIEKKIARVSKPAFIASIAVQSVDMGDAAPIVSNLRLKDLHISGDMVMSMDVKYTGGAKVVISALAKLDLGQRFKVRTVDLVLASILQRLSGRLLVRIKPPPSNRLWFCFEQVPDIDLKIEPVVSSRQITYTFILKAIENRVREVVAETLVHPNWDDAPFFNTIGQVFRGGIWQSEPQSEDGSEGSASDGEAAVSDKDFLAAKNEKTMSMPVLNSTLREPRSGPRSGEQTPTASSTATTASDLAQNVKRRSVASLPAQAAAEKAFPHKPMRSPSFASPSASAPSVAIDGSNVDAVRADTLPGIGTKKRWLSRPPQNTSKRDAVEAVREVHDRTAAKTEGDVPDSPSSRPTAIIAEGGDEEDPAFLSTEPEELTAPSPPHSPSRSRTTLSSRSSETKTPTRSSTSTSGGEQQQQRGKTLLAATAAATTAARQWTWKAVQARKQGQPIFRTPADDPSEPMGRGQPLPPPGQPLPGPKGSLWGASGFGSVKRKPVLPARRTAAGKVAGSSSNEHLDSKAHSTESLVEGSDGDFGPWRENFGEETSSTEKKAPPPLPPRRKSVPALEPQKDDRANDAANGDEHPGSTSATADNEPEPEDLLPAGEEEVTAIPAPVDAESEAKGSLELDEGDGVHVIEARDPSEEVEGRESLSGEGGRGGDGT